MTSESASSKYERQKAVKKIEVKLGCKLNNKYRNYLKKQLSVDEIDIILEPGFRLSHIIKNFLYISSEFYNCFKLTLFDKIELSTNNKCKRREPCTLSLKNIKKWYKYDSEHCLVILCYSIDNKNKSYNFCKLKSRYKSRIKSSRKLTHKFV